MRGALATWQSPRIKLIPGDRHASLRSTRDDTYHMRLLEKFDQIEKQEIEASSEKVLTHKISEELNKLSFFPNSKEMVRSKLYQVLEKEVQALTFGYEYGCYVDAIRSTPKPFYRAICWNLENGKNYKGILETLRNRALVSRSDIYFFPQTDIGMQRSGNRNVIRDLAIELGYNYFFATSYVNLNNSNQAYGKGESDRLGLEGNAIMTKLPLSNLRIIALPNPVDTMKGAVKRLGCQKVLLADLELVDKRKMTVVCVNLPLMSSQRQRYSYMKLILKKIQEEGSDLPILIGGDFKTSTYNIKSDKIYLMSVINKIYRGYDYIVKEHHTQPERHFEKRLFDCLNHHGFDYLSLNEMRKGSYHSLPYDLLGSYDDGNKIHRLMKKLLSAYNEKISFKYDWFAANAAIKVSHSHQAERAKVIAHLFYDGRAVSSHEPILLDFEVLSEVAG